MDALSALDVSSFNAGLALCAMFVSLLLASYSLVSRIRIHRFALIYGGLCLSNAVMAFTDLVSWVLPLPLSEIEAAVVLGGNFAFNAAIAFLFVLFGRYLAVLVEEGALREGLRPRFVLKRFTNAVIAVYLLICVVSIFTGWVFTVNPDSRFHRGEYFGLAQILVDYLYVQALAVIVLNRRCFDRREFYALLSYIFFPAVASLVQVAVFGFALVNISIAASLVLIFVGIQQMREIDSLREERRMEQERLQLIAAQIDPDRLYAHIDEARKLCESDPARAVESIGDLAKVLRERMRAIR